MKKIILTIVACVALSVCVGAQTQKVATISMRKAFDGYYKSKLMTQQITEKKNEFAQTGKQLEDGYKALRKQYETTLAQSKDASLPAEERAKNEEILKGIATKIKETEARITDFNKSITATMDATYQRLRLDIFNDIRSLVAEQAKASGYTLVIDSDSVSIDRSSVVVYDSGLHDITEPILKLLNVNSPLETPKAE